MFQGVHFGGCRRRSLCLLAALLTSQLSGNHPHCLVNMKGGKNNKNSHLNSCIRICQWNAAHRTIEVHWNRETLLDVMCRERTASRNIYVVLLWGPNEIALANSTQVLRNWKAAYIQFHFASKCCPKVPESFLKNLLYLHMGTFGKTKRSPETRCKGGV